MEKQLIPQLRFPEFEGSWEEKKLGEETEWKSGNTPSKENIENWGGNFPWISASSMRGIFYSSSELNLTELGVNKAKIALANTILILVRGSMLFNTIPVGIATRDVAYNQDVKNVIPSKNINIQYLLYWLIHYENRILNIVSGTGIGAGKLDTADLKHLKFRFPTLPEQEKIATFLSSVDTKISQLSKKKALLEQYKKGIMQQIFSQQIRFKDENGEEFPQWEEKKLSYYLSVSKKKNVELKYDKTDVLSVSGDFGIVNQIEFQGRSFAGESVHNYGLVETGDIVYTKSPLKSNPYGIIKVNKGDTGIVSTLYAIYKCKKTLNGIFLDYYFQLDDNTNRYLRPLVQKGSKNDMKINNEKVLIDPVYFPSIDEQSKIVSFLTSLDQKIDQVGKQLSKAQDFKKGLLQQMFV